jgi:hypothetical protein
LKRYENDQREKKKGEIAQRGRVSRPLERPGGKDKALNETN